MAFFQQILSLEMPDQPETDQQLVKTLRKIVDFR